MADFDSAEDVTRSEDRAVIEQLRKAGADLSKPREISHYLYFPSEDVAVAAARKLEEKGFAVDVGINEASGQWEAVAQHVSLAELNVITRWVDELTELAASLDGDYDGWEARAKP